MSPLETIDRLLFRAFTRGWKGEDVERYAERLRIEKDDGPISPAVGRTLQSIDGKAAALLTYTSMMVAALGVTSAVVAETAGQQAVIVVEMVLYLVISLFCLRSIALLREPDYDDRSLSSAVRDELILRQGMYRFCNRAAIYLTLLVLVSLPVLLIL
jgi:hypothetical protein